MKARKVVIYGKEDVKIIEQDINESDLGSSEVLIKTEVSLISAGTELSRVFALKKGATYPVYPGYCSVGRVIKAGNAIKGLSEGDKVVFSGSHASAQIFDPSKSDGGILFKLKDETNSKDASFMVMCWIALNGILPAKVNIGDNVVIMGLGTLGIITALYYQMAGCSVLCFDLSETRCKLAKEMGVKNVSNCAVNEQIETAEKCFGKCGADIAVDATGNSHCIMAAVKMTGKYGQIVLLGSPREEVDANVSVPFYEIHSKMLTVIGALNRKYPFEPVVGNRISMHRYLGYIENLLNEGKLPVNKIISHVIEPDEEVLLDSYRGLMYKKDEYTGVVIDWSR